MMWRDFLYFSKGERRALTLLLCLITIALILLMLTDDPRGEGREVAANLPADTVRGTIQIDTLNMPVPEAPKKATSRQEKQSIFAVKGYKRTQPAYASYPKTDKYPAGTVVELNTADSLSLKKVPGIGGAFSRRIVKYRELLGGFPDFDTVLVQ